MRRFFCCLLLASLAMPALAAFDVGELMGELARHRGGRAKFVEKKTIALLDKPLVSTGEMTYSAPGGKIHKALKKGTNVLAATSYLQYFKGKEGDIEVYLEGLKELPKR